MVGGYQSIGDNEEEVTSSNTVRNNNGSDKENEEPSREEAASTHKSEFKWTFLGKKTDDHISYNNELFRCWLIHVCWSIFLE